MPCKVRQSALRDQTPIQRGQHLLSFESLGPGDVHDAIVEAMERVRVSGSVPVSKYRANSKQLLVSVISIPTSG